MKKRFNFSLDEETAKKLKELADSSHTNMSQWITDKVWETAKEEKKSSKKGLGEHKK